MQGDRYATIWNDIVTRVKSYDNMDPSQIDAFFSRLELQAFTEGFAMLTADTEFIKKWIESHYMAAIKQALEDIYGVPFNISIEVDSSAKHQDSGEDANTGAAQVGSSAAAQRAPQPVPSVGATAGPSRSAQGAAPEKDLQQPPKANNDSAFLDSVASGYTFENFVRGSSNQMAYSMAVAVAETPGTPQLNPLFIYGRSGLGKTHLLRSIQNYVHKTYPQMATVYVDTMELVNDYTDAAMSKNGRAFTRFKQRYENADVLLIDDVQGLQKKTETLNMVFQILNRMIDHGKQVVLSADRAPKNIDIDERYKSRFNMGGTIDIQPPEPETKLGIIRNCIKECRATGADDFDFPSDVQEYIAEISSSNIRELKSAVTTIVFNLRNGEKSTITIDEAARLLANHFSGGAMKRLTIKDVQSAVEEYYGVSHAELVGKKRSHNITYARQIAIYLCRTMIDIPFNTIGAEFNRDHSTIMYSFRSVEEKVKESRSVNEELEILRQSILER